MIHNSIDMKKIMNYLFLAITLVAGASFATSCGKDYTEDINALDQRIAAIEKQNLAEVKTQLSQLSSSLNTISTALSSIQSKTDGLEGQINTINSTISSLQTTIGTLVSTADFNAFKTAYEADKANVVSQLGSINSTLGTLSNQVKDAATKADLTALQTDLVDRIAALSTRLDAMGLKLDALEASIKSVVFVPEYSDGKVMVGAAGKAVGLIYDIQPAASAKTFVAALAEGKATAAFVVKALKTRAEGPAATVTSITSPVDGQIVVKAALSGLEPGASVGLAIVLTDANGISIQSDYAVVEKEMPITVEYGGVVYNAARMADGRVWMTDPLRFVPAGKTVSSDPGDANGIWYPFTTAGVAETTEEAVKARGYLYDYATAFGVAEVNSENYKTFEGTQGICPDGWYIPTKADYFGLVGNSSSTFGATVEDSPYWDAEYKGGRIKTMDADGWNWGFYGVVNRASASATGKYTATKTTSSNCSVEEYLDRLSMSFLVGSTANPNITASTGNIQFAGLMSTFTNSYKEGRLTVAWSNYLSGYTIRCIRKD